MSTTTATESPCEPYVELSVAAAYLRTSMRRIAEAAEASVEAEQFLGGKKIGLEELLKLTDDADQLGGIDVPRSVAMVDDWVKKHAKVPE